MNALELRAAICLAAVYVMRMLGLFMVIPVIAIAATAYPDYSAIWVGIAIGGYGLTQALLQIPMGIASDRFGRKPIIYIGLLFFIIGSIVAATSDNMVQLTIGRIMQGMGAIAGAIMALAADVTRESQRTKIMAVIGISIGLSFYLALLLGPFVAANLGLEGIFFVTAIGATLCLPIIKFGVVSHSPRPSGDAIPRLSDVKKLIRDPQLFRLNVAVLTIHMLITSFFVQIPTLLAEVNIQLSSQWTIYGPMLLCSVLILGVIMRISKTSSHVTVLISSVLLMIGGFCLFFLIESTSSMLSWPFILIAGILFFAGFNYLEASFPAMVSSIAPVGKKGSAMGIYASFQFFGAFLGGFLSGILAEQFNSQGVYVFCIVSLVLLTFVLKGMKKHPKVRNVSLELPKTMIVTSSKIIDSIENQIRKIEGVQEVRIDAETRAVYVKAVHGKFDVELIHQVLQK